MPWLVLIIPALACWLDVARPKPPQLPQGKRNYVYVPKGGFKYDTAIDTSTADGMDSVLDVSVQPGSFGVEEGTRTLPSIRR